MFDIFDSTQPFRFPVWRFCSLANLLVQLPSAVFLMDCIFIQSLRMISKLNLLLPYIIDRWAHRINCIQLISSVAVTNLSSSKMLTTDNRIE